MPSNNNIYCELLYGTSRIICCRDSRKDKAQEDPAGRGAYALGVTPLIHFLSKFIFINEDRSKEVAFSDHFKVSGKASEIKAYWDMIQQQGPLFG